MGWEGDLLRLKIKGIPEKGRVNEELIAFLAKEFKIAKSQISMISGNTSRLKRLKIEGSPEEIETIQRQLSSQKTRNSGS